MRARTLMRSWVILLVITMLSNGQEVEIIEVPPSPVAKAVNEAGQTHLTAMEVVNAAYRKDLAAALAKGTEIEVCLLDFKTEKAKVTDYNWEFEQAEDQFPIIPYKHVSRILQRKKLTAEEIKRLMPSLQATVRAEDASPGAFCHYPIHGIRILDGDSVLFQTSICYMCGNFFLAYPLSDGASWVGLSSKEFEKVMMELMPVPEKEMDRFKKEFPGEGKK